MAHRETSTRSATRQKTRSRNVESARESARSKSTESARETSTRARASKTSSTTRNCK